MLPSFAERKAEEKNERETDVLIIQNVKIFYRGRLPPFIQILNQEPASLEFIDALSDSTFIYDVFSGWRADRVS